MNAQIRYGLASLLATLLLYVIGLAIGTSDPPLAVMMIGALALIAGALAFVAGIALLIIGLVRRPPRVAQQPPQAE